MTNKKASKITGDELAVGGQAVLEGVMMRGKKNYAVSVRNPTGKIERLVCDIPKKKGFALRLRKTMFVRGMFALFDSLKIGYKALDFSAEVSIAEEESMVDDSKAHGSGDALFMGITFIASIALAIGLFKFLPFFISGLLVGSSGKGFVWLEGLIKAGVFVGYILAISLSSQIRRVFQFHGAEHKAVHCYEKHGLSGLSVENCKNESRIHSRCGTAFLFLVIFVSILIYGMIPLNFGFWVSFGVRLLFLPVIAGISFEILQGAAKLSRKNPLRWIFLGLELPGLGLQYLTTREPTDDQIEVAIDALKHVV